MLLNAIKIRLVDKRKIGDYGFWRTLIRNKLLNQKSLITIFKDKVHKLLLGRHTKLLKKEREIGVGGGCWDEDIQIL